MTAKFSAWTFRATVRGPSLQRQTLSSLLIVESDDTRSERVAAHKLQVRPRALIRKERCPAAKHHRIESESKLIDQATVNEGSRDAGAADQYDVLAWLSLERCDHIARISVEHSCVGPNGLCQRLRQYDFGRIPEPQTVVEVMLRGVGPIRRVWPVLLHHLVRDAAPNNGVRTIEHWMHVVPYVVVGINPIHLALRASKVPI